MKSRWPAALLAVLVLPPLGTVLAQDAPGRGQEFYLEHCASCHGSDAAAFVRDSLKLSASGEVQTKKGKPLLDFLASHGPADLRDRHEMAAMFALLLAKPK